LNFNLLQLYAPTAKDLTAGLWVQRVIGQASSAAAAVTVNPLANTVPPDRMRVFTFFSVLGTAGAAQFFEYAFVSVFPGGGAVANQQITFSPPTRNAAVPVAANWTGELICYPGDVIGVFGAFNAGGAANTVSASLGGWDIPRANFN
jgi:hypothetical protein